MKIIDPAKKARPELNKEHYEQVITQLNNSASYPVILNIGRHIINSYTQDKIEQDIRATGYYKVTRRLENKGRYEVLEINYRY